MAIDLWNNNVMKWTCFPKDVKKWQVLDHLTQFDELRVSPHP